MIDLLSCSPAIQTFSITVGVTATPRDGVKRRATTAERAVGFFVLFGGQNARRFPLK